MNSFNLILSTNLNYEKNAETEIWFMLSMLGDQNPLIMHSSIDGILLVNTFLNPIKVIHKLRKMLKKDKNLMNFIMKLVPIQRVVETNLDLINLAVKDTLKLKKKITRKGSYAVRVKKRATHFTKKDIIDFVTENINFNVNLKNPRWVIRIEIIGNVTGVSILEKKDILYVIQEKR